MGSFRSIRTKALGFSLAFTLIPVILLGTYSYVATTRIMTEHYRVLNGGEVRQLGNTIRFMMNDVSDLSLFLIQNEALRGMLWSQTPPDTDSLDSPKRQLERSLMSLVHSKGYIHSIYVSGFNGTVVDSRGTQDQIPKQLRSEIVAYGGSAVWRAGTVQQLGAGARATPVFSLVRLMRDLHDITVHLGIIRINLDVAAVRRILVNSVEGQQTALMVLDSRSTLVSTSSSNRFDEEMRARVANELEAGRRTGQFVADVVGTASLITFVSLGHGEWVVASATPLRSVVRQTQNVQRTIVLLILGVFLLYALIATAFLRRFVSPVQRLCELMSHAESGRFDVYTGTVPDDEIGQLIHSFNSMSSRLEDLINRQYASQLKLREAELTALQSQINPHFLYNTLDVLYWVSRLEHAGRTGELVKALSQLFRYTLDGSDRNTTVEREVDHLANYLIIQQARHDGSVAFRIDVQPDALDLVTVKLILQPLVENAIVHGVDRNGGTGTVVVHIFVDTGQLVYRIHDDGPGMDTTAVQNELTRGGSHGVGLKNVHERIRLLYGEGFGVTMESSPQTGTTITVRQPVVTQGETVGSPAGR